MSDSLIRGSTDSPTPTNSQSEEWTNTLTHGLGLFLSLVGAIVLCRQAVRSGNGTLILGGIVYSASLVLVYLVSTLSHAVQNQLQRFRWRILDQGFIYLLIAGSYTGFSLPLLSIEKNQYLLGMIWVLALFCCFHRTVIRAHSDKNGTVSYLALGWIPIFSFYESASLMPSEALFWLIVGGIFYTIGVLFLIFDRRVPYFHAIWHLFVIAASIAHFLGVYKIVVILESEGGS